MKDRQLGSIVFRTDCGRKVRGIFKV